MKLTDLLVVKFFFLSLSENMEGDYEGISVTARALVQWSYHHYSLPLIQMGPYKERNENSVILSVIHSIYIYWDSKVGHEC